MATLTTESYNLIKGSADIAVEGFYREDSLRQIFQTVPSLGPLNDNYVRWQVQYDGSNNAETYTEDAAAPVAGYENHASAAVAITNFQSSFKLTGQVKQYVTGSAAYVDGMISEQSYALRNLTDLINTTHMATLRAAVDADGSYAGLTRATVGMASYELDYGNDGELLASDLDTMVQNLQMPSYASPYPLSSYVMLMSPETWNEMQKNTIADGGAGRTQMIATAGQESLDHSLLRVADYWARVIPIVLVPRFTDGVLCGPRETVKIVEPRRPTVEPLAKVNDAEQYLITAYSQIVCLQPRYWGKLYHTA